MSNADFKRRIERIQSKPAHAALHAGVGSSTAVRQEGSKQSPVLRAVGGLFCGVLGFAASTIIAFANANYDKLKADVDEMPNFVLSVGAAAGASMLLFLVFVIWGLKALLTFKKGRARNVMIAGFFIGSGVASLTLRLAAAGV